MGGKGLLLDLCIVSQYPRSLLLICICFPTQKLLSRLTLPGLFSPFTHAVSSICERRFCFYSKPLLSFARVKVQHEGFTVPPENIYPFTKVLPRPILRLTTRSCLSKDAACRNFTEVLPRFAAAYNIAVNGETR